MKRVRIILNCVADSAFGRIRAAERTIEFSHELKSGQAGGLINFRPLENRLIVSLFSLESNNGLPGPVRVSVPSVYLTYPAIGVEGPNDQQWLKDIAAAPHGQLGRDHLEEWDEMRVRNLEFKGLLVHRQIGGRHILELTQAGKYIVTSLAVIESEPR